MRPVDRLGLFPAHRERLVMRAGELLPGAQFGEHGLHVLDRAAHPFQFGVRELLPDECRAHLVVAEDGAVVALGGFVQFDLVVLDGGGLELLGDALLHVARCLPNLKETLVCLVVDRIGVDAWPSFRLRCEDFLDGGLLIVSVVRRFIEIVITTFSMKAISLLVRCRTSRRGPRPSIASSTLVSARRCRPCASHAGMVCAEESRRRVSRQER